MEDNKNLLKNDCDEMMERLSNYEVSPNEAQELATRFFQLAYRVNNKLRDVKNEIIRSKTLATTAYANAFNVVDEKANVSKAKAVASADKTYLRQNVELQRLENEESYWKNMLDLMNNGHIFYKLLARD